MLLKIKILAISLNLFTIMAGQKIISSFDNKINSPFSSYGVGDLYSGTFANNKAMGGTAIGLSFPNMVNHSNPASYSLQDTLSFILDVGFKSEFRNLKSDNGDLNLSNTNMDHIATSFSIGKRWGASLGLLPYSKTGYHISRSPTLPDSSDVIVRTGQGELNKFYIGNAFDLSKSISIGFNANYLFGKLNRILEESFPNNDRVAFGYAEKEETFTKGLLFDIGLLYNITKDENTFSFGLLYQPGATLKTERYYADTVYYPITTSFTTFTAWANSDTSAVDTEIPQKIGIGASVNLKNKLVVAFDYTMQEWSDMQIFGETNAGLGKGRSFNGGIEYIPNHLSTNKYFHRTKYRFGGYYTQTPVYTNSKNVTDIGLTAGIGLPFKNTKTMFNLSFELGKRGKILNNFIEEKYIKFNFNVSFYDFWFYRPKYD